MEEEKEIIEKPKKNKYDSFPGITKDWLDGMTIDIEKIISKLKLIDSKLPSRHNKNAIARLEESVFYLKKCKEDRINRGVNDTFDV